MQNPFETGHIKNYIYLYAGVVVIMILFFIAATLFRDANHIQAKKFNTTIDKIIKQNSYNSKEKNATTNRFKLLDKKY